MTQLIKAYNLDTHVFDALEDSFYNSPQSSDRYSVAEFQFALVHRIQHVIELALRVGYANYDVCIGPNKVSNLQVAAICENEEAVSALLQAGVSVDYRDARRWTALHHAALTNNRIIIDTLLHNRASPDARSDTGATFEDIRRLCYPLPQTDIPVFFEDAERIRHLMTPDEYYKLTGSTYIQDNFVTKEKMVLDWKSPKVRECNDFLSLTPERAQRAIENPLPLVLKRVTCDASGRPVGTKVGLGIFPVEPVEPNTIVGEYVSYRSEHEINPLSHYAVTDIGDAEKWGNPISRVNCGFPSLTMVSVYNLKGLPLRTFLVAMEAMTQEQLLWDYGFTGDKLYPYVELNPNGVRAFARSIDVQQALRVFNNQSPRPSVTEEVRIKQKFFYILSTPSVLYQMYLDGTLQETNVRELFTIAYQCDVIKEFAPPRLKRMVDTAKSYMQLAETFGSIHNQLKKFVLAYFFKAPEKYGIALTLGLDEVIPSSEIRQDMLNKLEEHKQAYEISKAPSVVRQELQAHFPNQAVTKGHLYWLTLQAQFTKMLDQALLGYKKR